MILIVTNNFLFSSSILVCCAKNKDAKHSITRQATLVGEVEPVIHLDRTQQPRFSRTDPSLENFDHVRFLPGEHKLVPHKQINVNTVSI